MSCLVERLRGCCFTVDDNGLKEGPTAIVIFAEHLDDATLVIVHGETIFKCMTPKSPSMNNFIH